MSGYAHFRYMDKHTPMPDDPSLNEIGIFPDHRHLGLIVRYSKRLIALFNIHSALFICNFCNVPKIRSNQNPFGKWVAISIFHIWKKWYI